ncbi:RNA polymerase sigma-70 factor [Chitinophaga defluvii]|uniref:RNA polymerase sigma-70 factor n=1 Tax=Chitinophaga defluvii TaxID=3163343 RepID=A0ABV2T961_9BACT
MTKIKAIDELTDEELLSGMHQKNQDVFACLYNHYFPRLVMIAEKYVKDLHIAKEIVQDVFMKFWESPPVLQHAVAFRSYLYRTVINNAINHLHRQKTIERHHLKISQDLTDEYIDTLHEEQELKIWLYAEIERLPEQCRKVFKMSRLEGLKYREIAGEIGIAEKTVENHIVHALKLLRSRIYKSEQVQPRINSKLMLLFLLP